MPTFSVFWKIDDDSSTETSASCYTGSEAEVSSGVSITQYDVMVILPLISHFSSIHL